jgi:hypothetical protein
MKTNLLHYLSSIHFVSQPLHVSCIIAHNHDGIHSTYTAIGMCYTQGRCLRVASGATAPGPALEGALRFRPKVVLMSLPNYILL